MSITTERINREGDAGMVAAWLIEANGEYWTADAGMCLWTKDPWEAVRFLRQIDAERVRLTATGSRISKAIQHSFEIGECPPPATCAFCGYMADKCDCPHPM